MQQAKQQDFTFEIANRDAVDKEFHLLGASYNGINISGGDNPDVVVPESSSQQVQTDNIARQFLITAMKITVSDVDQLKMPFYIVHKTMTGEVERVPLNLNNFRNPIYKDQTLIVLNQSTGFQPIKVWSDVGFEGMIKGAINDHTPTTMNILVTFQYPQRNYKQYAHHKSIMQMLSGLFKKAA